MDMDNKKKMKGLFKVFKRKRKQRDLSPHAKARPQAQDNPKTPDRPDHIPSEIDLNHESPRSMVSMLSLKSALEVAAERTSSVLQYRPPIRISNLLPSVSEGGESVEKSLLGGNSDRGTPPSRQPPTKKILFPQLDDDVVVFPRKSSFLTRTKFFRKIVQEKFRMIDSDGSGSIDRDELYIGVLMVHLELANYLGAAACQPASRPYVDAIFHSLDISGNGTLDLNEFSQVMIILCSQITFRVLIQWSMTLMIIPLIAHHLLTFSLRLCIILRSANSSYMEKYDEWMLELFEIGTRMLSLFNLDSMASFIFTSLPSKGLIVTTILSIILVPRLIDISDQIFLSISRRSNR